MSGRTRVSSPTRQSSWNGWARANRRPPSTAADGAWSPPMASRASLTSLDRDDLAAPVVAARGASPVGEHGLLALGAGDDLHRVVEVVVGSAAAIAAHLGRTLLGNSHGSPLVQLDVFQSREPGVYCLPLATTRLLIQILAAHAAQALAVLP